MAVNFVKLSLKLNLTCLIILTTCSYQVEVILDVDSLTEWCGRSEVSIDEIQEGEGYLEIRDGHTKVNL